MKAKDFLRIFNKLEMKIKEGRNHTIAEFWSDDHLIVWTKLSRKKGELGGILRHLIRQQLQLNEEQLRHIKDCILYRNDYLEILKNKRFL